MAANASKSPSTAGRIVIAGHSTERSSEKSPPAPAGPTADFKDRGTSCDGRSRDQNQTMLEYHMKTLAEGVRNGWSFVITAMRTLGSRTYMGTESRSTKSRKYFEDPARTSEAPGMRE